MRETPFWRRYLRLLGTDPAADVEEELAFHFAMRVDDLMARGHSGAEARAQAEREFGDVEKIRREMREIGRRRLRQASRSRWWSDLRHDVRYAGRTLRRSPGFTAVAVLTLALGIGATASIFTVVDAVLLRPLGVENPDELVVLREYREDAPESLKGPGGAASPANFFDWQEQAGSFSSMAYFVQWPRNLTGDGEPQEARVQFVSANFFSTLGVRPVLGRGFHPEEDDPAGEGLGFGQVAVLSHGLWQSRYGADPAIVGKTIRLDGEPVEVVGVMGPDFRVLDQKPDLWIPLAITPGNRTSQGRFLTAIGRLEPGATPQRAADEIGTVAQRLREAFPEYNTGWGVALVPLREQVVGQVRPALLVLLAAVGMLLLIACTNVANLLLGRATARRQEIAVHLSLGATRGRLVRRLLTESLVLALVGGAIGVTAAVVGTGALIRSLPQSVQLPRLDAVSVDARVLVVSLLVTLLTGVLFGLAPALMSSRADLQGALRGGGRGQTGGRAPMRLRGALVVAEVALALMLLVGAGLLLRSFQKLRAVDTGVAAEGSLVLTMTLGSDAYGTGEVRRGFLARLLPAVEGLPGVQAVGTVSNLPLTDAGLMGHTAFRPDRPAPRPGEEPGVQIRIVGGDYFPAQGVRLVRGRAFDERDHTESAPAFVINEALARQQFPGEDPVGKRLAYPWPDLIEGEVIGVVEDVRGSNITEEPAPALYRSFSQWATANVNLVIRTTGDPMALAAAVSEAVHRVDPDLPVASVRTMEQVVGEATARSRMSSYLLGAFAVLALLLAAIGLYGVISYGVTQRRGEIGVRVALGAGRGDILRLIVSQGLVLTALGLAVGLVGALVLTRLLGSLLFGVTTTDPLTFVGVPLVLVVVALLASYLPANRAARVDPATALRAQ